MKLKLILFFAVLGTALTHEGFAENRPAADAQTVINEFAESHMNTDAARLEKILSSDAILKFSRGDEVQSQNLLSILKTMRQNQGIEQNCSTKVDILAGSDALVLARVNFIYDNFTVQNYLTLEKNKSQNWKITRIDKFFTEGDSPSVLTKE